MHENCNQEPEKETQRKLASSAGKWPSKHKWTQITQCMKIVAKGRRKRIEGISGRDSLPGRCVPPTCTSAPSTPQASRANTKSFADLPQRPRLTHNSRCIQSPLLAFPQRPVSSSLHTSCLDTEHTTHNIQHTTVQQADQRHKATHKL